MNPQTQSVEEAPARTLKARATAAYASEGRQPQEQDWILSCLPLVRHIAQKISGQFGRRADLDELISAGTLGLVKAARCFDPTKDAEFRTYAYIRIRGAIIDELRGRSFIPAAARDQIKQVQEAYHRLASSGGTPADDDLAREAGMSLEDLYHTLEEARRQHFLCIHGFGEDQSALSSLTPLDKGPGPQDEAERNELVARLTEAIAALPARDRQILLLYYERDLTMKEVAAVLRVTESRVSQLHASALLKLAMKMKKE